MNAKSDQMRPVGGTFEKQGGAVQGRVTLAYPLPVDLKESDVFPTEVDEELVSLTVTRKDETYEMHDLPRQHVSQLVELMRLLSRELLTRKPSAEKARVAYNELIDVFLADTPSFQGARRSVLMLQMLKDAREVAWTVTGEDEPTVPDHPTPVQRSSTSPTPRRTPQKVGGDVHVGSGGEKLIVEQTFLPQETGSQKKDIMRIIPIENHMEYYYYMRANEIGGDITARVNSTTGREKVPGETLRTFVNTMRRSNMLTGKDLLHLIYGICDKTARLNNGGILHCDMKPANIIIKDSPQFPREGMDARVRIIDFGFALDIPKGKGLDDVIAKSGDICGTPMYMAPEQIENTVKKGSDLYAVGMIMYELLSGKEPIEWSGSNPAQLLVRRSLTRKLPEVDRRQWGGVLADLVEHMTEWEARDRPDWDVVLLGLRVAMSSMKIDQPKGVKKPGFFEARPYFRRMRDRKRRKIHSVTQKTGPAS